MRNTIKNVQVQVYKKCHRFVYRPGHRICLETMRTIAFTDNVDLLCPNRI